MPVTIDFTTDSITYRISTETHEAGGNVYDANIVSIGAIKVSSNDKTGGFVKPRFGNLQVLNEIITGPPPTSADVPIEIEDEDFNSIASIQATGTPREPGEATTTYDLLGPEYPDVQVAFTIDSNFFAYLTTVGGGGRLNKTFDTTYASNFNIRFTTTRDLKTIDLLHDIMRATGHGFYDNGTSFIVLDLLKENTVEHEFDDYEYIFPLEDEILDLYSRYSAGDFSIDGGDANGSEFTSGFVHSTVEAEVTTKLTRLKTILEKKWITVRVPIPKPRDAAINYGDKITITGKRVYESVETDITVTMAVRVQTYSITGQEVLTIEGEGEIV